MSFICMFLCLHTAVIVIKLHQVLMSFNELMY